jgi:hypothetical protein
MAESATAPLRAEPFVAASKVKVRANDNLDASARNGWARMPRFGHYAARPLLTIVLMMFGAGLALAIAVGRINRDQDRAAT